MTLSLVLVFVTSFIIGPLVFRIMTQRKSTRIYLRWLIVLTITSVLIGLLGHFDLANQGGGKLWVTGGSVGLIWFAWIGVLAFSALALRRTDPSLRMRRWTAITGALCTTVPWFGLVSASMMQG